MPPKFKRDFSRRDDVRRGSIERKWPKHYAADSLYRMDEGLAAFSCFKRIDTTPGFSPEARKPRCHLVNISALSPRPLFVFLPALFRAGKQSEPREKGRYFRPKSLRHHPPRRVKFRHRCCPHAENLGYGYSPWTDSSARF